MKIYIVFEGAWDEEIGFITTSLKEAYNYIDTTPKTGWCDLREYEINKHQFRRPDREELLWKKNTK